MIEHWNGDSFWRDGNSSGNRVSDDIRFCYVHNFSSRVFRNHLNRLSKQKVSSYICFLLKYFIHFAIMNCWWRSLICCFLKKFHYSFVKEDFQSLNLFAFSIKCQPSTLTSFRVSRFFSFLLIFPQSSSRVFYSSWNIQFENLITPEKMLISLWTFHSVNNVQHSYTTFPARGSYIDCVYIKKVCRHSWIQSVLSLVSHFLENQFVFWDSHSQLSSFHFIMCVFTQVLIFVLHSFIDPDDRLSKDQPTNIVFTIKSLVFILISNGVDKWAFFLCLTCVYQWPLLRSELGWSHKFVIYLKPLGSQSDVIRS